MYGALYIEGSYVYGFIYGFYIELYIHGPIQRTVYKMSEGATLLPIMTLYFLGADLVVDVVGEVA